MIERGTVDYRGVAFTILENTQWPAPVLYEGVVENTLDDYRDDYTIEDIQSVVEDLIRTGFLTHDQPTNRLSLAPFPPVELQKILDTPPPAELTQLQHDILGTLGKLVCASAWGISSTLHADSGYPYLGITTDIANLMQLGYIALAYWDASLYHLTDKGRQEVSSFVNRHEATAATAATAIPPRPEYCDYSVEVDDCPRCQWDAQYGNGDDDDEDDLDEDEDEVTVMGPRELPTFEIPRSCTTDAEGTTTYHYEVIDPEPLPMIGYGREASAPVGEPIPAGAPADSKLTISPEVLERAADAGKARSYTQAMEILYPGIAAEKAADLERRLATLRLEEQAKPGFPADYVAPDLSPGKPYPSAGAAIAMANVAKWKDLPLIEPAEAKDEAKDEAKAEVITVTDPTWDQVVDHMPRSTYTMEKRMKEMAAARETSTTLSTEDLETIAASAVLGTILLEKLQVSPMGRNLLINILKPWVEVKGGDQVRVDVRGGVLTIVTNSINDSLDAWVNDKCDKAVEYAREGWDEDGY